MVTGRMRANLSNAISSARCVRNALAQNPSITPATTPYIPRAAARRADQRSTRFRLTLSCNETRDPSFLNGMRWRTMSSGVFSEADHRAKHAFVIAKASAFADTHTEALDRCVEKVMDQLRRKGCTESDKIVSVLWVSQNNQLPLQSDGSSGGVIYEDGEQGPTFLESIHGTLPRALSRHLIAAVAMPFKSPVPTSRHPPTTSVSQPTHPESPAAQAVQAGEGNALGGMISGDVPPAFSNKPRTDPSKFYPPSHPMPWVAVHTMVLPEHYDVQVFHAPNDSLPELCGDTWKNLMRADASAARATTSAFLILCDAKNAKIWKKPGLLQRLETLVPNALKHVAMVATNEFLPVTAGLCGTSTSAAAAAAALKGVSSSTSSPASPVALAPGVKVHVVGETGESGAGAGAGAGLGISAFSGPELLRMSPNKSLGGSVRGRSELVQGSVGVVMHSLSAEGPPKEVQRAHLKEWLLDAIGDVKLEDVLADAASVEELFLPQTGGRAWQPNLSHNPQRGRPVSTSYVSREDESKAAAAAAAAAVAAAAAATGKREALDNKIQESAKKEAGGEEEVELRAIKGGWEGMDMGVFGMQEEAMEIDGETRRESGAPESAPAESALETAPHALPRIHPQPAGKGKGTGVNLPLFVLRWQLPLIPGGKFVFNIFEPRYKHMIKMCLDNSAHLVLASPATEVGTACRVIAQQLRSDGSSVIEVVADARVSISSRHMLARSFGLTFGRCSLLHDVKSGEEGEDAEEETLRQVALETLSRLLSRRLSTEAVANRLLTLKKMTPQQLSMWLISALRAQHAERHRWLAMTHVVQRLRAQIHVLRVALQQPEAQDPAESIT